MHGNGSGSVATALHPQSGARARGRYEPALASTASATKKSLRLDMVTPPIPGEMIPPPATGRAKNLNLVTKSQHYPTHAGDRQRHSLPQTEKRTLRQLKA